MMTQSLPKLLELRVPPHDKITTLALVMPDANSRNLCHGALNYLDAMPKSSSFRVQAELYQNNPSKRSPTTADFEQSGVFSTAEAANDIVPLRDFLLKDQDQVPRRKFLAVAKQANLLPVLNNAVNRASQGTLHKVIVFTAGTIAKARGSDLETVMSSLHSKDIPVVIYHTYDMEDASPTLYLLQKHGAQLMPLVGKIALSNPFSISCEITSPFCLRQDIQMKLWFALHDMYDPRFPYTVKVGGGKYFKPAEFIVPPLTSGIAYYTVEGHMLFDKNLSQIINDVDLLEKVPDRFTIHIFQGLHSTSRTLLDCQTVGYSFSFYRSLFAHD